MHVEVDPRDLGSFPERSGAPGVPDLRPLVALRVAQEELHQRGAAVQGLGDRIGLVDVCANWKCHGASLDSDSPPTDG